MTAHTDLLVHLLPLVSYDPNQPRLAAELVTEGVALDAACDLSIQVMNGITPFQSGGMLPDWERVCGLIPAIAATYQERVNAVLAKLAETGGLSIAYFMRIATRAGYSIRIIEPEPFRAGVNRSGDRLSLWPDTAFFWRVEVLNTNGNVYQFCAGQSCAGERLLGFGDPILETMINDLKPADTYCDFIYPEA